MPLFAHPDSVCMSYTQHCKLSIKLALLMLLGSIKAVPTPPPGQGADWYNACATVAAAISVVSALATTAVAPEVCPVTITPSISPPIALTPGEHLRIT